MAKSKFKQYRVFIVRKGYGCYSEGKWFAGSTWAVSPEKACSNVRYRGRGRKNPNGGSASWVNGDYAEEGFANYYYEAEEV